MSDRSRRLLPAEEGWEAIASTRGSVIIYRRDNGLGGYVYGCNEGGVATEIWDTSRVSAETLQRAIECDEEARP